MGSQIKTSKDEEAAAGGITEDSSRNNGSEAKCLSVFAEKQLNKVPSYEKPFLEENKTKFLPAVKDSLKTNGSPDEAASNIESVSAVSNKFVNDGSFLTMILEQQREAEAARKKKLLEEAVKKKRARQKVSTVSDTPKKYKNLQEPPETKGSDDNDPVVLQAKQEFIRVMEIMEEAGLVTEKGIGTGMVK